MADQNLPEFRPWRELLPVHPAAELFPLISGQELQALADDIKKTGLQYTPVFFKDDQGVRLLDGRSRLDAMMLAGISLQGYLAAENCRIAEPPEDPYDLVVSFNISRRHLTFEQREELVRKLLAAHPERSNRAIAEQAQVSHPTVATVRRKSEAAGTIPKVEATTGLDGRTRTATPTRYRPGARMDVLRMAEQVRTDLDRLRHNLSRLRPELRGQQLADLSREDRATLFAMLRPEQRVEWEAETAAAQVKSEPATPTRGPAKSQAERDLKNYYDLTKAAEAAGTPLEEFIRDVEARNTIRKHDQLRENAADISAWVAEQTAPDRARWETVEPIRPDASAIDWEARYRGLEAENGMLRGQIAAMEKLLTLDLTPDHIDATATAFIERYGAADAIRFSEALAGASKVMEKSKSTAKRVRRGAVK